MMRSSIQGGSLPGCHKSWSRGYTKDLGNLSTVNVEVTTLCMNALQEDWCVRAGVDGLSARPLDVALMANRIVNNILGAHRDFNGIEEFTAKMQRYNDTQTVPPVLGSLWRILSGTEQLPNKNVMGTVFSPLIALRLEWGREENTVKETYAIMEAFLVGGQNHGETARPNKEQQLRRKRANQARELFDKNVTEVSALNMCELISQRGLLQDPVTIADTMQKWCARIEAAPPPPGMGRYG